MAFHKHIPEQTLIDFALGNLDNNNQDKVIYHTEQCHKCQDLLKNWQYMLSEANDETAGPSSALKARLDHRIDEENKSARHKRRVKPVRWAGIVAAVLLLTIGLTTFNETDTTMNEDIMYNEEISETEIQSKPETKQLDITPVSRFDHVSGNVWINDMTREILVEVDGLESMSGRNYQMWMVDTDDNIYDRLLPIQNGSVRVLYQGKVVENLKLLKISVEPAGGSQKPTGPETFSVDFPL